MPAEPIRVTPGGRVLAGAGRALAFIDAQGRIPTHAVEWVNDRGAAEREPADAPAVLVQVAHRLCVGGSIPHGAGGQS